MLSVNLITVFDDEGKNYDYIFYFFNNQYPDFGGSACTLVRFVKIFYALLEGCRIGDVKDCL